jgi:hypothetical protein
MRQPGKSEAFTAGHKGEATSVNFNTVHYTPQPNYIDLHRRLPYTLLSVKDNLLMKIYAMKVPS